MGNYIGLAVRFGIACMIVTGLGGYFGLMSFCMALGITFGLMFIN